MESKGLIEQTEKIINRLEKEIGLPHKKEPYNSLCKNDDLSTFTYFYKHKSGLNMTLTFPIFIPEKKDVFSILIRLGDCKHKIEFQKLFFLETVPFTEFVIESIEYAFDFYKRSSSTT